MDPSVDPSAKLYPARTGASIATMPSQLLFELRSITINPASAISKRIPPSSQRHLTMLGYLLHVLSPVEKLLSAATDTLFLAKAGCQV